MKLYSIIREGWCRGISILRIGNRWLASLTWHRDYEFNLTAHVSCNSEAFHIGLMLGYYAVYVRFLEIDYFME